MKAHFVIRLQLDGLEFINDEHTHTPCTAPLSCWFPLSSGFSSAAAASGPKQQRQDRVSVCRTINIWKHLVTPQQHNYITTTTQQQALRCNVVIFTKSASFKATGVSCSFRFELHRRLFPYFLSRSSVRKQKERIKPSSCLTHVW